jgi:hypothetical protein
LLSNALHREHRGMGPRQLLVPKRILLVLHVL